MIIKNNQKVYVFILILITVFVLGGCGGPSKKELADQYIKQVQPIINELQIMANEWEDVKKQCAEQTISDVEVCGIIQNSSVRITALQQKMEVIKVDKELQEAHELGIKMVAKQQQASTEMLNFLMSADMSKLTEANKLLYEARETERKYAQKLEELRK